MLHKTVNHKKNYFSPKNVLQKSAASALVILKESPWNCPPGKMALISANMWLKIKDSLVRFLLQRKKPEKEETVEKTTPKDKKYLVVWNVWQTQMEMTRPSEVWTYLLMLMSASWWFRVRSVWHTLDKLNHCRELLRHIWVQNQSYFRIYEVCYFQGSWHVSNQLHGYQSQSSGTGNHRGSRDSVHLSFHCRTQEIIPSIGIYTNSTDA